MFIETFINHVREKPSEALRATELAVDFLQKSSLTPLVLPPEYLAMLIQSDGDAATKLQFCISERDDVEADLKEFAHVKDNKITSEQRSTISLLPYRMRKLGEACESAATGLAAIVPHALLEKPMRGTLGELSEAQRDAMLREKAGSVGSLHLRAKKLSENRYRSTEPLR